MACSSLTFASVASEIGLEESDLDALQEACSTEDFGDGDFLERIWPLVRSTTVAFAVEYWHSWG